MESWRRQKVNFVIKKFRVQDHITESHLRACMSELNFTPFFPASWQPTVPLWEKKFCTSIGSVPWSKLLETKRSMYLYENVVQWNDSAGEEAFRNAKTRFWAEFHGIPCDISLPDPDIYIDDIDWNSNIDPELLLDLEREPKATEQVDENEKVVILNSALLLNQSFSCTGWGDAEQDFHKDVDLCLAANHGDCTQNTVPVNAENSWERNCTPCNEAMKDDGWRNCWNNSWGWNQHDNHYNEWDISYNESKNVSNRSGGDWGMYDMNSRKREGTGWYMSRYKTSRFRGDDYHLDRGWKNRRLWKRSNVACEVSFPVEKHSSGQWNSMNSCEFGKAGISWSCEKQVL